ncbi:hypothetical protein ACWEWX_41970, partial [Streptomyces asiaticus]
NNGTLFAHRQQYRTPVTTKLACVPALARPVRPVRTGSKRGTARAGGAERGNARVGDGWDMAHHRLP